MNLNFLVLFKFVVGSCSDVNHIITYKWYFIRIYGNESNQLELWF